MVLGAQQIGAYGGQMNSDIILESTGPRLYSAVYHAYIPLPAKEEPYPGELQARARTCLCPCPP